MTGRQKKTTKRLAWLLTLFLVISAILPQPMRGGEQPDRTGCDGGDPSQQNKSGDEDRGK
mgnify:CR=1 FL=1